MQAVASSGEGLSSITTEPQTATGEVEESGEEGEGVDTPKKQSQESAGVPSRSESTFSAVGSERESDSSATGSSSVYRKTTKRRSSVVLGAKGKQPVKRTKSTST